MVDFKGMAATARQAHTDKLAADKAALENKKATVQERHDNHRAAMNAELRPMLEQAQAEFRAEGVSSKIEEGGAIRNHDYPTNPTLRFVTLSGPRESDGYVSETAVVFFEFDGHRLKVGAGEHGFDRESKRPLGETALSENGVLVTMALSQLLTKHFEEVSRLG